LALPVAVAARRKAEKALKLDGVDFVLETASGRGEEKSREGIETRITERGERYLKGRGEEKSREGIETEHPLSDADRDALVAARRKAEKALKLVGQRIFDVLQFGRGEEKSREGIETSRSQARASSCGSSRRGEKPRRH